MERIQRPKDLRTNPFTFRDIVPFTIWSPQHIHKDCSLEMCPQEGKCISVSPEQVRCSAWALGWLGAWHEPWVGWGLSVIPGPAGSCFSLYLSDHPDGGWAFIFVHHLFMAASTLKEHQKDHEEMSSSALTSWARQLCKYSELWTLIRAGVIPLSIIGALEKETKQWVPACWQQLLWERSRSPCSSRCRA